MKLVSCHIINFGSLSDIDFNFDKNFNEFYLPNGEGKTTLCEFILAMFYGLDRKSKREFSKREHFYPYNKGVFGGNLKFIKNNKEYVVERIFSSSSESKDTYKLYINKVVDNNIINLGEEIFGVDREGFIKTIFVNNADIELKSTDSINTKLNNLAIGVDEVKFSKAIDVLKSISLKYSEKGRSKDNYYNNTSKRIKDLKAEISKLSLEASNLTKYQEEVVELDKVIKGKEVLKADNIYKTKDLAKNKKELIEIENKYYILPNRDEINNLKNKLEEREKKQLLQNHQLDNSIEEDIKLYEELKGKLNSLNNTLNIKYLIWGLISIVFLGMGLILFFINSIPSLVVIILSLISLMICLIIFNKDRQKRNNIIKENADKFKEVDKKLTDYFAKYNITSNYSSAYQALKLNFNSNNNLEEIKQIDNFVNEFKANHNIIMLDIYEIEKDLTRYELIKEEIAKNKDIKGDDIDITKDIERRKEIRNKIEEINNNQVILEDKKIELNEEVKKLDTIKHNYILYEKTISYLNEANININNKYIKPIETKFSNYAKLIEESISKNIKMNADLEIMYEHNGTYYSVNHLSEGERTICSFCFRLALLNNMYDNEIPFLILDDPFTALDEKHLKKIKDLINQLPQQILYFTCHNSRKLQ